MARHHDDIHSVTRIYWTLTMCQALVGPSPMVQNSVWSRLSWYLYPLTHLGQLIIHSFSDSCDENIQTMNFKQGNLISTWVQGGSSKIWDLKEQGFEWWVIHRERGVSPALFKKKKGTEIQLLCLEMSPLQDFAFWLNLSTVSYSFYSLGGICPVPRVERI